MSYYKCPKCKSTNLAIERRPNGDISCIDCKFKDKAKQFVSLENQVEEVILKWQRKWMDVKDTNEFDRKNYFDRSAGIDANMRFSLAKMIIEEFLK